MHKTRAQANRAVRQEALRQQLAAQGHLQHVIDMANEIAELDKPRESLDIQRLKIAIDTKLRLIAKYLPDLKAVEHTGEGGGPLQIQEVRRTIVNTEHTDS